MTPDLHARHLHARGIHRFDIYTPPLLRRGKVQCHPTHMAALLNEEHDGRDECSAVWWDEYQGPAF
jgi:hypothetical protein